MLKIFAVMAMAVLFASVAMAGDPMVFTKGGKYHIHTNVVTAMDDGGCNIQQPVYLACGEDESKGDNVFVGNAWMQDKGLQGVWDDYKLVPPASGSKYWTLDIPEEVRVKKIAHIRCGIVQEGSKGKFNKWAHIEFFRMKVQTVNGGKNLSLSTADDL